jgi:hypothetical protein
MRFIHIILALGIVILIGCTSQPQVQINSFDECIAAGYPMLKSYPPQCKTPDGKTFVQQKEGIIMNEVDCQLVGGAWTQTPLQRHICKIDNEQQCKQANGSWTPQGKLQQSTCIFTYPDAGKSCTSSDECVGGCLVNQPTDETGICKEDTSIFGCYTFIDGPGICVD